MWRAQGLGIGGGKRSGVQNFENYVFVGLSGLVQDYVEKDASVTVLWHDAHGLDLGSSSRQC